MVSAVGTFFIVIFVLLVAAAVGWVVFTQLRARRLGLPAPSFSSYNPFARSSDGGSYGPPQPAPGGVTGWFNAQMRKFKNRNNRSAVGAYEHAGYSSGPTRGRRGFGALDPDEAWDARVGTEAEPYGMGPGGYYEEQELGVHPSRAGGDTGYHGGGGGDGYNMNLAASPALGPSGYEGHAAGGDRGRTLSRSPGLAPGGRNPFDDDAEPSNISLRGVSPRPIDTGVGGATAKGKGSAGGKSSDDSPTERRSIFTENV